MQCKTATQLYETWLASKVTIVEEDLEKKHKEMKKSVFAFLRGTFYRWIQLWSEICVEVNKAPLVLAVGDLHIENFGTWRDKKSRLIWGINDFDEACWMPYTIDLVRLAASTKIAAKECNLKIDTKDSCKAILEGYQNAIEVGGQPFVLEENHEWLRSLALGELHNPNSYWEKLARLPSITQTIPKQAIEALEKQMPEPGIDYRIAKRTAGLGSLGRQRFVAITDWRGGKIACETKPLISSAYCWANGNITEEIMYQKLLDSAVRSPDPFLYLHGNWIVRRLAPDYCLIDMTCLPKERDEYKLLSAMGWETANIHLGTIGVGKAITADLSVRQKNQPSWFYEAVKSMARATSDDWQQWKENSSLI